MPLLRQRSHYQQLPEFERGRVIELRGGRFSFRNIAKRLGRNVSIEHDCCNGQGIVLLQEDRVPGGHVARLKGKTAVFSVRLRRIVLRLLQKSSYSWYHSDTTNS
ncbi:uncharacterized protein TNCV_4835241 [Trichonephila clavipes]|nr:uncharacterized protein TNCV_4835241 [Trichonephila clavipes]